jgi:hypothetical protein
MPKTQKRQKRGGLDRYSYSTVPGSTRRNLPYGSMQYGNEPIQRIPRGGRSKSRGRKQRGGFWPFTSSDNGYNNYNNSGSSWLPSWLGGPQRQQNYSIMPGTYNNQGYFGGIKGKKTRRNH